MKDINIFYHAYVAGTNEIFLEQMSLIEKSGILEQTSNFYVNLWTDVRDLEIPLQDKIILKVFDNKLKDEHETIKLLYDVVKDTDSYVLYFHTKGGSDPSCEWRKLSRSQMSHQCVTLWKSAIETLKSYDTYGIRLRERPEIHYSGNFWWATSDYIKRLNRPVRTGNRLENEFWIGRGAGKNYDCKFR